MPLPQSLLLPWRTAGPLAVLAVPGSAILLPVFCVTLLCRALVMQDIPSKHCRGTRQGAGGRGGCWCLDLALDSSRAAQPGVLSLPGFSAHSLKLHPGGGVQPSGELRHAGPRFHKLTPPACRRQHSANGAGRRASDFLPPGPSPGYWTALILDFGPFRT